MFSYPSPDALVPRDHPLRSIRPLVNVAPEKLLRALLLQAFHGVRSGRQLMEQVTCNMG